MDDAVYHELASVESVHWWFQGRRQIMRDVLHRRLGDAGRPARIVDIGCGTGEMLDMVREFGPATGLDASPIALEYCRERFADVALKLGRIPEDLPLSVDLITAFDVVEHLEDDAAALSGVHASLVPGGLFVCTVPAFSFLWSGHDEIHHHYRRYTRRTLRRRLEAAGFRVERISYFNMLFFPLVAAIRLRRRHGSTPPTSDMALPSPRVNSMLRKLFSSERWLLARVNLPVGVSLLAVCRKAAG